MAVENKTALLIFKCDLTGKKIFEKYTLISESIWNPEEADAIIDYVKLDEETQSPSNPFSVLRTAVSGQQTYKHGETCDVYQVVDAKDEKLLVVRTKQLISVFDDKTGKEIACFSVKPGVQLFSDGEKLIAQYVSDQQQIEKADVDKKRYHRFDVVSQALTGDNFESLKTQLQFVTPVSEESTAVEQQMKADLTKLRPTTMTIV